MPRWLPKVLRRIHELGAARRVMFTAKAQRELALLEPGLDEEDACEVLVSLTPEDSTGRVQSMVTNEWMYLFKPQLAGIVIYLKLVVRSECVVISFHEDEAGP